MTSGYGIRQQQIRSGFGFGYNVAVFANPHTVGSIAGRRTFLWDGAARGGW